VAIDYTKVKQLDKVLELLQEAHDYELAVGTNANLVLAGGDWKAAFFGTLSTQPTIVAADLTAGGLSTTAAAAVIAERDRLRTYFLGQAN
jgi:hypothetical protein